ncbi:MAG: hypothetical protein ACTHMT_09010 [Verrucomicrobiota bacterium]|jgi:hypothetical protein
MNSKRQKKNSKPEVPPREKVDRGYTLEQPIQTALYVKLGRFGRDVN